MACITLFLVSLALSLFCTALALDIQGKIQWNEVCPGLTTLGAAKVVLDNGRLSGSVTHNGSFLIPDVPVGTYLLSVIAHDYVFEQRRIDVLDSTATPEVRPYIPGTPLEPPAPIPLVYPITLPIPPKNSYFVPRESFNLVGMFQNPMMLLMVIGGGMVLAMPYIMKNLDPEVMQELQNRQAGIASDRSVIQSGDMKSRHSPMANGDDRASDVSSGARHQPNTTQPSRRNNRGKRR